MFLILVAVASLLSANPQNAASEQRIVAASNVRLRSAPQTTSDELARLPLGAVLTELETSPDAKWIRVQTQDAKTGWVFRNLTEAYSDRDAISAYLKVIQARLKVEMLNFNDAAELMEFVSRVTPDAQHPARADFDLSRLRALDRSLNPIIRFEPRDPAHREWIKKNEDEIVYSEPAGQWLVRGDLYWELEQKHRGRPIADEIAWQGARAGIPGECEGYIPCEFAVLLMTDARYLELYPSGAHMTEALEHIDYPLQEILKPNTPYVMDPRESTELRQSITKLTAILERVASPQIGGMLVRLKRIEQTYR
jgi:hypothetical protein